jgi:hypothetical protein
MPLFSGHTLTGTVFSMARYRLAFHGSGVQDVGEYDSDSVMNFKWTKGQSLVGKIFPFGKEVLLDWCENIHTNVFKTFPNRTDTAK